MVTMTKVLYSSSMLEISTPCKPAQCLLRIWYLVTIADLASLACTSVPLVKPGGYRRMG
jgi:hypothetical protein